MGGKSGNFSSKLIYVPAHSFDILEYNTIVHEILQIITDQLNDFLRSTKKVEWRAKHKGRQAALQQQYILGKLCPVRIGIDKWETNCHAKKRSTSSLQCNACHKHEKQSRNIYVPTCFLYMLAGRPPTTAACAPRRTAVDAPHCCSAACAPRQLRPRYCQQGIQPVWKVYPPTTACTTIFCK